MVATLRAGLRAQQIRDKLPLTNGFVMATNRRKFKVTKPFIARLAAVVLFVCLGTFAVIQSIHQSKKNKAKQEPDPIAKEESQENTLQSEIPIQGVIADNAPQIAAKPASFTQEDSTPLQSETNNLQPGTLPDSNQLPVISTPEQGSIADNSQPSVSSQQFSDLPNRSFPDQQPPSGTTPPLIDTQKQSGQPAVNPNQQFGGAGQFGGSELPKQSAPPLVKSSDQFGDLPAQSSPATPAPKQFELPANAGMQETPNQTPPVQSFGDTGSTQNSNPQQSLPQNQEAPKTGFDPPTQTNTLGGTDNSLPNQIPVVSSEPTRQKELAPNNLRTIPETNQTPVPQKFGDNQDNQRFPNQDTESFEHFASNKLIPIGNDASTEYQHFSSCPFAHDSNNSTSR